MTKVLYGMRGSSDDSNHEDREDEGLHFTELVDELINLLCYSDLGKTIGEEVDDKKGGEHLTAFILRHWLGCMIYSYAQ